MGHGRAIGKARARKWDRDSSRATPQPGLARAGASATSLFCFSFLFIVCSVVGGSFFFFFLEKCGDACCAIRIVEVARWGCGVVRWWWLGVGECGVYGGGTLRENGGVS